MKEEHREGLLEEKRLFFPPTGFSSKAVIQNPEIHELGRIERSFGTNRGNGWTGLNHGTQF